MTPLKHEWHQDGVTNQLICHAAPKGHPISPMISRRGFLATLGMVLLIAMGITSLATPALAQGNDTAPNRAGLVVVHEDGSVISRCVGFEEESISGYELLVRGEFAPHSEITSGGASVCSIEGQGCGEGEDCFCQCQSSPCLYWTYWQQLPEGWRYSNVGAATLQVHNRDVQGWVWGESRANAEAENAPPALAFADICTAGAVVYGLSETGVAAETGYAIEQPWLVTFVVAAPLLLGGTWLLLRRRKVVQS